MGRVIFCVVRNGCLLWPEYFFYKTLLAFALLHFVLQGQSCLQLQVSLDFLHFCIPIPYDENGIFCDVSSKKCYRSSQNFPTSACFSGIASWGIDLDYCDVEWFALEMNWDHSVIFEIAHKYCIVYSSVDYEGYSISSNRFLPTVVDIMVIWIKFAHSHAF